MDEELPKIIGWLLFVLGATGLVSCMFGAPWPSAAIGAIVAGVGWWVGHPSKHDAGT